MPADVRQYNFSGGELSPLLHHRSDLDAYGTALRRCRNFIPTRHGALLSRPGTEFVRMVSTTSRCLPFVISDDEAWLVEVRSGSVRFHRDGRTLLNDGTVSDGPYDGTEMQLTAPWHSNLQRLRYAQSGLTMVLAQQGEEPHELRQKTSSPVAFELTPVTMDLIPYAGGIPALVEPIPAADAAHPALVWYWGVSLVYERPDGTRFETALFPVGKVNGRVYSVNRSVEINNDTLEPIDYDTLSENADANVKENKFALYPDRPHELHFKKDVGGTNRQVETRVYRGRGGLMGLVDVAFGAQKTKEGGIFVDYGGDPDYGQPPPQGQNPFRIYDANDELLRTEHPNTVGYFDGRLVFGGTAERGGHLWFSAVNRYRDFDERVFLVDAGAATIEIATTERQEIRSLLSLERLLAFTDFGVWVLGDSPITGAGINSARRVNGAPGASWLQPLAIPGGIFYVTRQGTSVRNLAYSQEAGGYSGSDMSFFAQHFFEGKTVKAWAYAETPWGVLWVVLSDGSLLSFTYEPSLGIAGWAMHETQGLVQDVCVVPEGDEDAVYLVVQRQVPNAPAYHCLERMSTRRIDEPEDAVCLDCATIFPNATSGAGPFTSLSGLGQLAGLGRDVWAVADGHVIGPLQVETDGTVDLPFEAAKVAVGFRYICEAETLDVPAERLAGKRVVRALVDVERSRHFEIGVDENALEEWSPRRVEDSWNAVPLFTGSVPRFLKGRWADTGRVLIRQSMPMPLTITGITREIEGGSR